MTHSKNSIYKNIFILITLCLSSILNANSNLNIIVSILPQQTFVKAIGQDKVNISLMVKPGNSPHTYEPKPSQMRDISKADIYFSIGVEFEKSWLPKFSNQNHNMKIINLSKNINKIEGKDIHTWTSPSNVKIIAKTTYDTLVKFNSKNKTYYKQNYDKFISHINKTDAKIKSILKDTPKGTKFMVFHPGWGHFAKDYNLVQLAIEIEGKSPKPKQIAKLINIAREEKINAILTAPEFSTKIATQIANELNIQVIKITPLNPKWSQNLINLAQTVK